MVSSSKCTAAFSYRTTTIHTFSLYLAKKIKKGENINNFPRSHLSSLSQLWLSLQSTQRKLTFQFVWSFCSWVNIFLFEPSLGWDMNGLKDVSCTLNISFFFYLNLGQYCHFVLPETQALGVGQAPWELRIYALYYRAEAGTDMKSGRRRCYLPKWRDCKDSRDTP